MKKEKLLLYVSPPILPETFFDPGERKKKQETFRQIGCVEKKRRKLCQFETALPKLHIPSTINTDYRVNHRNCHQGRSPQVDYWVK